MRNYGIPLVPGPTIVPERVRNAYMRVYGSPDIEEEFIEDYRSAEEKMQKILGTKNSVVIMTGEGMLALWSALKSCFLKDSKRKQRVLAITNGIFGEGIGEMARSIGYEVLPLEFEYDEIPDPDVVDDFFRHYKPDILTYVHCETPSGVLNPLEEIGEIVKNSDTLFYVDVVSSAGGVEINADKNGIDLCLVGSQKCLSMPPVLSMIAVSEKAWDRIRHADYKGYDSLKDFEKAVENHYFPYTPSWESVAALNAACDMVLGMTPKGLRITWEMHKKVAKRCIDGIKGIGLEIFPKKEEYSSPTVTAVKVPEGVSWQRLDEELRKRRVVFGGSWGPLKDKVFRIGHMGSQARMDFVEEALYELQKALYRVGR